MSCLLNQINLVQLIVQVEKLFVTNLDFNENEILTAQRRRFIL